MRSLRVQFIAAILVVLALGLAALLLMAGVQMSNMTMQAFTGEKRVAALAIASNLGGLMESWHEGEADLQQIQAQIADNARNLGLRVSLITPSGDLIAGSQNDVSPAQPSTTAVALSQGVSSEIQGDHLYVTAPVSIEGDGVQAFVWVDAPLSPVQAELQGRWLALIGAALGALALACGTGWWLSGRIVGPLTAIRLVSEQMAAGRLDVRANVSETSTELASLGRAFNRMAQEIEGMLARQRDFVANASHELRSPLAAIKIRAEVLASGALGGERARQYAVEINEETTRLGQLVADLLHLSRTDSRSFSPPVDALNVVEELSACARTIQPRIAVKHQQFAMDIQDDVPDLYIHSNDLRMMVCNLLDNAVKYTPDDGYIALSAHWIGSSLIVEVCDTGEGIPPADLTRVTERFFRVDRSHNRAGTGLGLSLVQATAQQYHGLLTIDSTGIPGEGTRARLVLKPEYKVTSGS